MRFLTLVLLLALTVQAAGRCDASPAPYGTAAERARASAVIVWSHIADHRDAIGAGVIVGYSLRRLRIVTARHVVVYGAITVWRDGVLYPAEVARTFAHRDLAIVDAFVPAGDPVRFSSVAVASTVTPGEPVVVWGEDASGPKLVQATLVTTHMAALGDPDAPELVDVTCDDCRPGDSGGGIFDRDGNLVAILTARYHTADGRTVAVVAEPIDDASLYAFG